MATKETLEETVAKLDELSAKAEIPVRDDTEGHVEGPEGTWNTSGIEVAKPVALHRDATLPEEAK